MLKLDEVAIGRPYVETIRLPAIAELVARRCCRADARRAAALAAARPLADDHGAGRRRPPATRRTASSWCCTTSRELRRADQIRRDFVANVSHELRTPLTAIRGYVEALSDGETTPGRARRFLDDHRAPHAAHGAAGQGSAAPGAARRRSGNARPHRLRHARPDRDGVAADVSPALAERGQRIARRIAPAPRPCAPIRRSCTTRCATSSRTRSPTRRSSRRSVSTPRASGDRVAISVADDGPGHSRGRSVARVRAVLPRRQVARARPGRHGTGPRDREAPRRAARRNRSRREWRRARRTVYDYGRQRCIMKNVWSRCPRCVSSRCRPAHKPQCRRRRRRGP